MMAKRLVDVSVAGALLILLSPVMLALAVLVRARLGSPVLFRQQRPGVWGEPFTILKFRTMTDARGPDGELLPDAERLTQLGRRLRALSLDELPELFNVLRGDMSLVGPRPLLMSYLDHYSPEQARRHEVLPGITGWAQVNGRNLSSWQDRLAMDVWYVDHQSFWLDVRILLRTIPAALRRSGISEQDHATRSRFDETGHP